MYTVSREYIEKTEYDMIASFIAFKKNIYMMIDIYLILKVVAQNFIVFLLTLVFFVDFFGMLTMLLKF